MRPHRMWFQPTLFPMLQPYWPFICFNIPRLFPPQGPCSWILPPPGMPHTSMWQALSYYLGFSSKVTWPSLTLLPKSSPPNLYLMTLFYFLHSTYYYLELPSSLICLLVYYLCDPMRSKVYENKYLTYLIYHCISYIEGNPCRLVGTL